MPGPSTPGSDFTFGSADVFSGKQYFNPSASIVITLPAASEGVDFEIWHVGASNTITIDLPGGTDLIVLSPGQMARIQTYSDTAGDPQYKTFGTYTITNGTTDRTYDANATTVEELADVLYTLISDLKARGLVA